MQSDKKAPLVAIACGGTGGHLFPGLAVAEALRQRACGVALLVSQKEVDQQGVKSAAEMDVITLPAVALQRGHTGAFLRGGWQSFQTARQLFRRQRPQAVLAMGGFTSAPPILAGKLAGAATFIHEANSIPGRANRWLAPLVDQAFAGFPSAARRLRNRSVLITGTPVREQFQPLDPAACRTALGLNPDRPVLLVMGGSQGAAGINELVLQSMAALSAQSPNLQFLHLTGPKDTERVRGAYAVQKRKAIVQPFLTEMELALGAATVAVSRAGASSLAELAAVRVPAILIPYPTAADNHQFYNARALAETGAARLLEQKEATPGKLTEWIVDLTNNPAARNTLCSALPQWHFPDASRQIADRILAAVEKERPLRRAEPGITSSVGSTGDSPVPSGDPPDGTASGPARNQAVPWPRRLAPVPPGESPSGAGGSPALPSLNRVEPGSETAVSPPGDASGDRLSQRRLSPDPAAPSRAAHDPFAALEKTLSRETVLHRDEPMAKRTTLRVGGKADLYVEPASEADLAAVLQFCSARAMPFVMLGRGSNLLIRDGGLRGVVICLAHPCFSRIEVIGETLHCGAGAKLKTVAVEARRHGLTGLEFLEGIPGSVGGAMRMNAGAMGSWLFDVVERIRFMDFAGQTHERAAGEVNVEYRGCPLFRNHIALSAVLKGQFADQDAIRQRMDQFSRKRWESQPSQPSAGCIFKNPQTIPAGRLIDELGLKGSRVGGAVVSDVHANFIVNDGHATARDVLNLIDIIQQRAKSTRGIELETEVEIIGENPPLGARNAK